MVPSSARIGKLSKIIIQKLKNNSFLSYTLINVGTDFAFNIWHLCNHHFWWHSSQVPSWIACQTCCASASISLTNFLLFLIFLVNHVFFTTARNLVGLTLLLTDCQLLRWISRFHDQFYTEKENSLTMKIPDLNINKNYI